MISLTRIAIIAALLFGCATDDSVNPVSAVDQGNQYARDGLLREAAQSYRKALTKDAANVVAHRNLGLIYIKTGEYKKAILHLQKALPKFRDNFETNFYLAQALRAEERYGDAIYYYKIALEQKPGDPKTLKALAWSNYKIRYYTEAFRLVTDLQKVANDDVQTHIITARVLLKMQKEKKALVVIKNAQTLAKKSELPYLQSVEGDVLMAMKKWDEAQKSYRAALKEQPLLAGSLLGLGRSLIETGQRTDQAIVYIERALRIKPQLKEGLFDLGKFYEKSDPKRSARYYRSFKKQAASDPEFADEVAAVTAKLNDMEKKSGKPEKPTEELEGQL